MSKSLNDCAEPFEQPPKNLDPVMPHCVPDKTELESCRETPPVFYKDVADLDDLRVRKSGLGEGYNCDPMQAGRITNSKDSDPDHIYRYAQGLRAIDEAIMDLFSNLQVADDFGKIHTVPVIMGGQEAAVAVVLKSNVRKDNTLVTDRIRLPIMALSDGAPNQDMSRYIYHKALNYRRRSIDGKPGVTVSERWERDTVLGFTRGIPVNIDYTLSIWTMYKTDMKQILEQVLQKLTPVGYIRLQGVPDSDNIVKLKSIANNEERETEPGAKRVIKAEVSMEVEAFIPQPIARKKAVLSTKIDIVDGLSEEEITFVIGRLEEVVEEFKNV